MHQGKLFLGDTESLFLWISGVSRLQKNQHVNKWTNFGRTVITDLPEMETKEGYKGVLISTQH